MRVAALVIDSTLEIPYHADRYFTEVVLTYYVQKLESDKDFLLHRYDKNNVKRKMRQMPARGLFSFLARFLFSP